MSDEATSPFLTMPIEIIHAILHRLDIKDILQSFRYVCTDFYRITNEYRHYKVHIVGHCFESDVRHLCRVIRPENITLMSLKTTCDVNDRVSLFLSLTPVQRLTRLSCLTMNEVNKTDYMKLLPHLILLRTLKYLTLDFPLQERPNLPTSEDHSLLITKESLHYLRMSNIDTKMEKILSTNVCSFRVLQIDQCDHQQMCRILPNLSQLEKFSSNSYFMNVVDQAILSSNIDSLVSLNLKIPHLVVDQLESFLRKVPSLTNLRLSIYSCDFDFLDRFSSTGEQFIHRYLPRLKHFKFFLRCLSYDYQRIQNLEILLNRFRSPFWIERFGCSMICKYINDQNRSDLTLFSHPDPDSIFPDNLPDGAICYTTSITSNDPIFQWSARFNLSEFENSISTNVIHQTAGQLFDQIRHLALSIDWPINNFNFLSKLFKFSQLHEIWLFLSRNHFFELPTLTSLLDLADNVVVMGFSYDDDSTVIPSDMLSLLDNRIDQLKIRTNEIKTMISTLEQINRISIVTFERLSRASSTVWDEIVQWLVARERQFSLDIDRRTLQVVSPSLRPERNY